MLSAHCLELWLAPGAPTADAGPLAALAKSRVLANEARIVSLSTNSRKADSHRTISLSSVGMVTGDQLPST